MSYKEEGFVVGVTWCLKVWFRESKKMVYVASSKEM